MFFYVYHIKIHVESMFFFNTTTWERVILADTVVYYLSVLILITELKTAK